MKADNRWYAYTYDDYGRVISEGFAVDSLSSIMDTLITNSYGTTGAENGKLKSASQKLLNIPNDVNLQQEYIYDACGRNTLIKSNSILHPTPGSIVDSLILDSRDMAIESYQKVIPDGLTIKRRQTYDHAGREKKSFIQITTPEQTWPEQELSEKSYTVKEQVNVLKLGGTLQEVNYGYLPNRLLNSINTAYNSFGASGDLFGMLLGYDTSIDAGFSGLELKKDGNISHVQWSYKTPNSTFPVNKRRYRYKYDYLKRLAEAYDQYQSGANQYTTTYAYADHRGNFSSITRKYAGSMIDNLNYNYYPGTNKIKAITDGSSAPFQKKGYKANTSSDFTYDANGAMDYDAGRGVDIQVNHLDLPNKIIVPDSNGMIMYYYSADGQLQRQEEIRDSIVYKIRDYIGAVEYVNGAIDQIRHSNGYITLNKGLSTEHLMLSGTETADQVYESLSNISERIVPNPRITIYTAEEFIVLTPGFQVDTGAVFSAQIDTFPVVGLDYRYFIKDHLGNIRVEFKDNGSGTAVTVSNHNYYPFGMRWEDSSSDSKNNYFYNGKELQKSFDLDYLNYGARFYDPSTARWTSVDPLADHPNQVDKSSYAYAWNNPVKYTDPDGRCPICPYIVGAISGAALDYAVQVGSNLYEGKGASSFTDIDGGSLLVSAGAGATGVGLAKNGGKLLQMMKGGSKVDDVANVADDVITKLDDVKNPFLKKSKSDLLDDKNTFSNMIKDHQSKLDDFIKDPIGNSSEKWLKTATKDNPTKEVLLERAKGRISALQKQIQKQQGELNKINDALKKIDG